MMLTGIVTLHQSANFGAFLQAFALQQYLRGRGRDTAFIDVDYRPALPKRVVRRLRQLARNGWIGHRQAGLLDASVSEHLSTLRRGSTSLSQVFIGSDEVWSVANRSFRSCPEFFGLGLDAQRISAYAPSMGQSTAAQLAASADARAGLQRIDDLSGRDSRTVAAVAQLTGRNVTRVVDPTFLIDWEPHVRASERQKTLLVYSYALDDTTLASLKRYASQHGLKLVVTGLLHPWADEQVAASPFEFLGLLRSAAAVATDTFHGTIFSVLMGANFVVLGRKQSNKRTDLVDELGLQSRVWTGDAPLEEALVGHYRFDAVNGPIAQRLQASLAYLSDCLGMSPSATDAGRKRQSHLSSDSKVLS